MSNIGRQSNETSLWSKSCIVWFYKSLLYDNFFCYLRMILVIHIVLVSIGTLVPIGATGNFLKLLSCFSAIENTRILFQVNEQSNDHRQYRFMHGIRVFSIYWVVFAHVLLFHPFLELPDRVSPVSTLTNKDKIIRNPMSHFIVNAGLAVGTFFLLR